MSKTIFEKVISGEFEGSFVYKDDLCVAFMDLNPLNPGHVLVVPREAVDRLSLLSASTAGHLFSVAQKILKAIEASDLKCDGANLFMSDGEIAGQEVPHVHLHILPRIKGDGVKVLQGHSVKKVDRTELNRLAGIIAKSIK